MQLATRSTRFRAAARFAALLLAAAALAACATLPDGRTWGEDTTVVPGWQRVRDAATGALESPRFWGPLLGAAVFQVDGWDRKISNWARVHVPLFGSERDAVDWSGRLRTASGYVYVASVLATPSGDDPQQWLLDKLRGAAVGLTTIGATDEESWLLKNAAGRERPNGLDTQSMPSSHTSRSAVLTELAARNVQSLDVTPATRRVIDFGLDVLTYGTAWARVESGYHFPSDTLVGMSLGNFNGAFFNDAFLGLGAASRGAQFSVTPLPRGAALTVRVGF